MATPEVSASSPISMVVSDNPAVVVVASMSDSSSVLQGKQDVDKDNNNDDDNNNEDDDNNSENIHIVDNVDNEVAAETQPSAVMEEETEQQLKKKVSTSEESSDDDDEEVTIAVVSSTSADNVDGTTAATATYDDDHSGFVATEPPENPKTPPLTSNDDLKTLSTGMTAPETTVSVLDESEVVSDLEQSPPTDFEKDKKKGKGSHHDSSDSAVISIRADPNDNRGDDSSSNDESSYFNDPSHLPEPGCRRYSWSSNASNGGGNDKNTSSALLPEDVPGQHNHHPHFNGNNNPYIGRESDASLSLSDDSDEGHHHHHHSSRRQHHSTTQQQQQPFVQPPPMTFHQQPMYMMHHEPQQGVAPPVPPVVDLPPTSATPASNVASVVPTTGAPGGSSGVPELYPEQITRMHSVSSLVSESSHTSNSDTSARDELRSVTQPQQHRNRAAIPSGRQSPILGEQQNRHYQPQHSQQQQRAGRSLQQQQHHHGASPSTVNPSPPTIQQALPNHGAMLYPHPQAYHHNMMMAASAASTASSQQHYPQVPPLAHQEDAAAFGWVSTAVPTATASQQHQRSLPSNEDSAYSRDSDLAYSVDSGNIDISGGRNSRSSRRNSSSSNNTNTNRRSAAGAKDVVLSGVSSEENQQLSSHREEQLRGGGDKTFEVYWQRWIMLFYMSLLNLLSDWTCYSVAPIALLTEEAFGHINPEQLVVVFLGANGLATACEPIILSRLGLRRTVLFGALLLMIGSIIKSGGMPPIIKSSLTKGEGEWRVYLGFFLVGLSQPLYQCTPALLSASWFPEKERTMATGVALNANQLGIGFAFVFGCLLVEDSDDIPSYFSLLSIIATLAFLGALVQFADAPPTPPSETARVVRGTLEVNLPEQVQNIVNSVRYMTGNTPKEVAGRKMAPPSVPNSVMPRNTSRGSSGNNDAVKTVSKSSIGSRTTSLGESDSSALLQTSSHKGKSTRKGRRGSSGNNANNRRPASTSNTRRRNTSTTSKKTAVAGSKNMASAPDSGGTSGGGPGFHSLAPSPSPAHWGDMPVNNPESRIYNAPSPMQLDHQPTQQRQIFDSSGDDEDDHTSSHHGTAAVPPPPPPHPSMQQQQQQFQYPPFAMPGHDGSGGAPYMMPYANQIPPQYQQQYQQAPPYWDPQYQYQQQQQYGYYQQPIQPQPGMYQQPGYGAPAVDPYYNYYGYQASLQHPHPMYYRNQAPNSSGMLPSAGAVDEGAEPVLTITKNNLGIEIRDDQILLSTKACLARPGFIHSLVSFTVSGIVINTLSTFMDYLVRLNGAPRTYTGIVGGSFQFLIMASSLIIGKVCDRTRAYYSITMGMLVLGAFGLAECGVSLDADDGNILRYSLVVVAILVGPLQPISTELGVDVVYPLSENTVLVIQQLFSNLLSAAFIPCFKAMKDFGITMAEQNDPNRPSYTFSFYLLIVLHAAGTVFFATFNGQYVRFEHEKEKKAKEERRKQEYASRAFHEVGGGSSNIPQHQQHSIPTEETHLLSS